MGSAIFAQLTTESPYTLQWAAHSPSKIKIAHSHGVSRPHLIHGTLGPTQVHTPNGTSIGSAVFAGLVIVTDRPTNHATPSIAVDGI